MLRRTNGVCPVCHADVEATVVVRTHEVVLQKRCPTHGRQEQLLSKAPRYWTDLDRFYFRVNGTNWPQRDFIVRMTESCNLDCPICLAKANTQDTPDLDLTAVEALLAERDGLKIDLMAAEPTLRADLEDWIRRCKQNGHVASLHTNGLKLAKKDYLQRLVDAGLDEVFLQFDGLDDEANKRLRGRPLLKARMKTVENLRECDVSTSFITVIGRGLNEKEVGNTLRFALQPGNEHVKEVFFLGLRLLGSARAALDAGDQSFGDSAMMPDEIIDLLAEQEPRVPREDVRRFNKLYFTLLSVFGVKKCLYVQHYLLVRDDNGGYRPISELVDLERCERAAERYAEMLPKHPRIARARFLAELATCARPGAAGAALDLLRLQDLFRSGMNLRRVPRRFLLVGFITACDPWNFDAQVAINCGKGEVSSDGGFVESGAVANVRREARFAGASVPRGTPGAS